MAQNITIQGASYSDVPAVQLPKTGGGTAQFDDTTDADATASDIASGKTAYVNGQKLTGTGSGGGGGTKTYIVKDGVIQSGYTFSTNACVLTEETEGGIHYLKCNGTANNQYEAIYTPLITPPNSECVLVLELVQVSGYYGYTWWGQQYATLSMGYTVSSSTQGYNSRVELVKTTGYIQKSLHYLGVPASSTDVSIKLSISGDSSHRGYANIKNLYFLENIGG